MVDQSEWPGEWLRGALEVCVLRALADEPTYGYEIASRLSEAGLGPIKGGTLYPLLKRFEDAGWVEVEWRAGDGGPGRKYYVLTGTGRAALEARAGRWLKFAAIVGRVLESGAAHGVVPAAAGVADVPTEEEQS